MTVLAIAEEAEVIVFPAVVLVAEMMIESMLMEL